MFLIKVCFLKLYALKVALKEGIFMFALFVPKLYLRNVSAAL